MFFWNSLAFLMIQRLLAIWSLVPLPFLKPDVHAGFRKGRESRDQIANIHWIINKAREVQKTSISALLAMPKPLTVWITVNFLKF